MNIVKSLLLSSAAGFLAVAGAQAADLPARKAAPVEYVKVCSAYGAGFWFIPGTDTCIRVGGYVRAEYQYTPGHDIYSTTGLAANGFRTQVAGDQDTWGMEIRGRIDVDGRTQTAWGTAQTVIQLRGANVDGIRGIGATATNGTGYAPSGSVATAVTMERAYVRFAGFTFGVSSENFVTFPSFVYHSNISAGFPNGIKQIAYTGTFGGGWSATVALESKGDFTGSNTVANGTYVTTPTEGIVLVGNVRVDQSWGFAQLSAAVTQNSYAAAGTAAAASTPANNLLSGSADKTAWAVGFGAKINLPMLAAGDAFYFSAAYSEGLNGLVGCSVINDCSDSSSKRNAGGVLYQIKNVVLTSFVGGVNNYGQTRAWNVVGLIQHFWSPQWRSNLEVGYNEIYSPAAAASAGVQPGNASIWGVVGNLIWSPVQRLDIGVELAYYQGRTSLQNVPAAFAAAGQPGIGTNGGWSTKMRVERLF